MYLYIARHAWAGQYGDPAWPDDSLRELTSEGIDRYTRMVQVLAQRGFEPRRIATSPYARCRQTAEIISLNTPHRPPVEELTSLEPGSEIKPLLRWSRQEPGDVCWVGHSPDVGLLAGALVSDRRAELRFAKGAIAAVRFHGTPAVEEGELIWLVTAKVLGV